MTANTMLVQDQYPGGKFTSLALTAASVIKASRGTIVSIIVQACGTSGNLT